VNRLIVTFQRISQSQQIPSTSRRANKLQIFTHSLKTLRSNFTPVRIDCVFRTPKEIQLMLIREIAREL
jgi:hypothetical protein